MFRSLTTLAARQLRTRRPHFRTLGSPPSFNIPHCYQHQQQISNFNSTAVQSFSSSTTTTTTTTDDDPLRAKGEVLYEADRARLFKAASAFSVFNITWWFSLAGFDIMALFNDGEVLGDPAVGLAVAPELTAVGTACAVAIVGLVKFYSSKNVGLVVLDPSCTKVMIATHNMLGRLVPREISVNQFTKSPHNSSQYHLFKMEEDKWYTMIDRDVGKFYNEAKLIRVLEGRMAGQVAMPTRSVADMEKKKEEEGEDERLDGIRMNSGKKEEGEGGTITSKRAAQNRQRKKRKQNTRR